LTGGVDGIPVNYGLTHSFTNLETFDF